MAAIAVFTPENHLEHLQADHSLEHMLKDMSVLTKEGQGKAESETQGSWYAQVNDQQVYVVRSNDTFHAASSFRDFSSYARYLTTLTLRGRHISSQLYVVSTSAVQSLHHAALNPSLPMPMTYATADSWLLHSLCLVLCASRALRG